MATITTEDVKRLREETNSGVMDAKRALEEADGNFEKAKGILREKGIAAAAKRSDRETKQGMVDSYIHGGGRIGVIVEVQCETDFVARTDTFKGLARDIAMQVAAMNPLGITPADVPAEHNGTVEENALMTQSFIKDSGRTISDLVSEAVAQTGENIRVARFARFELGA